MKKIQSWMEEKKRKFMDLAIARKIRILLFVVSLLPLVCTLFISNQLSASIMRNQTTELIQANLEQSASNVENFWQTYEDIIQSVYMDDFYAENLEPINLWDNNRYYFAKKQISERLQNIINTNREILGVMIVGQYYDVCLYDSITKSSHTSFCFDIDDIRKNEYVITSFEENSIICSSLQHISNPDYGNKDVLYLACQLRNFEDYDKEPIGCVLICVDEQALKAVYGKSNTGSNITLITNQYGDIISFPLDSLAGVNIVDVSSKDGKKVLSQQEIEQAAIQFIRENKYLKSSRIEAVSEKVRDGDCYVINVRDSNYAMENLKYIVFILMLFGVLAGLACMLIAIIFSEQVDWSVKSILRGMDKADQGDLTAQVPVKGNDEFAWIARQFNRMIDKIRKSNEQEREAMVRKKNAEIKSLEAQINPHFLYNTLDAINWVAIEHKEYTISRMLTSLAAILRYSIHKSNEIVKLQSELEYLRKYVYLQQQRFDYSFLCTIDADESIFSLKIHKLLIQPLLENTLVHGFPGNTGMDEITIQICLIEEDLLQITIDDNGVGMSQEMVDMFNHFDYQKERIESSIGVRNVITRLKLYYGERGSFHMESGNRGTRITMKLPYEK